MTAYCVLSDIHANADAFAAAIAAAKAGPCDQIIVAGDLLTYGPDVERTLELTDGLVAEGARVLVGNHDQMYFELARGQHTYFDRLPDWLRETAEWTSKRLSDLEGRYAWLDDVCVDGVLVSHANPFGPRDWRYLNDFDEHTAARETLSRRGLRLGVFGHTHRQRSFGGAAITAPERGEVLRVAPRDVAVVNAGSIGQPRDRHQLGASFIRMLVDHEIRVTFERVDYDAVPTVERIVALGLSSSTTAKLTDFFRATGPGRAS